MEEKTINLFEEDIATKKIKLLKCLLGKKISNIIRCSWDLFTDYDPEGLYSIKKNDFFRFTSGAVIIECGLLEIGFSSLDNLSSITVWLEKDQSGKINKDYFRNDPENHLIGANDNNYTTFREKRLIGQEIVSIKILKREPLNSKHEGLPNAVGIQFEFDSGESMIFAHNLVEAPDNFCITYKDEISFDTWKGIIAYELNDLQ